MRIGLSLKLPEPKYNVLAQNVQALFADGSQGWFYDNQDLTTLFQDSAGTTPVTAVEQSVGLQLDKSKGLVRTNIAPNTGTSLSGWTFSATNGGSVTSTASGILLVTDGSGTQFAGFSITGTANIFYEITATVEVLAGAVDLQTGVNVSSFFVGTTTRTTILYSSNGQTQFKRANSTVATTAYIRNISVRELPGNHRYQTTSGSRPVWSKRVNRLTKTEQFDDAVWTKSNATVTANATTAPDGTLTADKLVEDTATSRHTVLTSSNVLISNVTNTISISVKTAERNIIRIIFSGTGNSDWAWINTDTGVVTIGSSAANGLSATSALEPNGFYRFIVTLTPAVAGAINFDVLNAAPSSRTNTYTGDGTSGIYIWGADLRPANQATGLLPLYQRVNTSTDYDTNGFPGYLKADGTDDFLVTNSIDFTATDKITLCAGVRKLSDATRGMVTESAITGGVFQLNAPRDNGVNSYSFGSGEGGALFGFATATGFSAPITNVLTGVGNISGDSAILRINGAQAASSTADQGTGNFGNYPVYFFRRGGASLPFNGEEYANIAVGKLLTADQLTALETYVNGATKAFAT